MKVILNAKGLHVIFFLLLLTLFSIVHCMEITKGHDSNNNSNKYITINRLNDFANQQHNSIENQLMSLEGGTNELSDEASKILYMINPQVFDEYLDNNEAFPSRTKERAKLLIKELEKKSAPEYEDLKDCLIKDMQAKNSLRATNNQDLSPELRERIKKESQDLTIVLMRLLLTKIESDLEYTEEANKWTKIGLALTTVTSIAGIVVSIVLGLGATHC